MEQYKDEIFNSLQEYEDWRPTVDQHKYSVYNSVSATAANPKRDLNAQINPETVQYYKRHYIRKVNGQSTSGNHQ